MLTCRGKSRTLLSLDIKGGVYRRWKNFPQLGSGSFSRIGQASDAMCASGRVESDCVLAEVNGLYDM